MVLGTAFARTGTAEHLYRVLPAEYVTSFLDTRRSDLQPSLDRRSLLSEIGEVARETGDPTATGVLEAVAESLQSDDPASAALAARSLGAIAFRGQDADTAERRLRQALILFRRVGWSSAVATCDVDLGTLSSFRGDYRATQRHARSALSLFEQLGDSAGIARTHMLLGQAAEGLDDLTVAESQYRVSWNLFSKLGDRIGSATSSRHLGLLALRRADYGHAYSYLNQSQALSEESDDLQSNSQDLWMKIF